jgi:hypothetical protein
MRLSQREQIVIQKAAYDNPGPLAEWLLGWVNKQQEVGVSGSFDITTIVLPQDLDRIAPPVTNPYGVGTVEQEKKSREAQREEWRQILAKVKYTELEKPQRKAINKFRYAIISAVEESDRLPDTRECWLGDHDMEGWEADDYYLWVVVGKWVSDKVIRKWGCKECAMAIANTHPGVVAHAFN